MIGDITTYFPSALQKADQQSNMRLTTSLDCLFESDLPKALKNIENKVQVYLRSSSKKSFKVDISSNTSVSEVKSITQDKFGIPKERQLLFLNGKNITDYVQIQLQSLSIIHVSNRSCLLKQQEQLLVKMIIINSFTQNNLEARNVQIQANQTVDDFLGQIEKELQVKLVIKDERPHYYLLESGRLLDRQVSFYQQNIAEDAQMICLITKREVKTRFVNDKIEIVEKNIEELVQQNSKTTEYPDEQHKERVKNYQNATKQEQKQTQIFEQVKSANNQLNQEIPRNKSQKYLEEQQTLEIDTKNKANFKRKLNVQNNSIICSLKRPLAKKLKAYKTKEQIEQMLQSQGQKNLFICTDIMFSKKGIIKGSNKKISQQDVAWHKPSPSIPKVMPVEERRRISLEMQKLFQTGGSSAISSATKLPQEEESPKSPPTENPPRLQKKKEKMQNLRNTMGSRSDLINIMRSSKK